METLNNNQGNQPQPPIDTAPTPTAFDETPKKRNYLPWLLGILVLTIVFVAILLVYVSKSKSTLPGLSTQTPVPLEQNTIDTTNIDMSSWKTYINRVRGFEFKYPNNLEIYSDMGMDYSDDSIYLYSKSNKFPYCGVQSISKKFAAEEKNLGNMKVGSLKELIDNSYKQAIENQNTPKRVIQPVQEGIFSGKKMYKYVVEQEGIDMIWGSEHKERSIYTILALEHNDSYIMIGCGDNNIYSQILSTFKFVDRELINFLRKQLNLSENATITIEKDEGDYVLGNGGEPEGSGFYWAAAKKDGQWNYAFAGNGIPSCSEVEVFPVGTFFREKFGGKFDECYQTPKRMINRNNSVKYNPQAKLYISKKLELNLYYLPSRHDSVKEEGDRIYVTSGGSEQFVEIFPKKGDETMIDAINRILLKKFDKEKCFIVSELEKEQTKLYDSSTPLWTLPIGKLYEIEDKTRQYVDDAYYCPEDYSQTNGARYFVEDENDKTKFYFYEIGQYTAAWEIEQDKIWKP